MASKKPLQQNRPDDAPPEVQAPNALLFALEARAPWEFGAALAAWPMLRLLGAWPKGDGHSVIVFPGLAAGDVSTQPLRAFLNDQGFKTQGWGLGLNRGAREGVLDAMREQVRSVANASGRKVSLVGWSLGGIYARELAKLEPERVRNVITLGTPFSQNPKATNAWRVYEFLSGSAVDQPMLDMKLAEPPRVPTTSVYSKTDGVVAWQCSIQSPSPLNPRTENVEIFASHIGIGLHPAAWYAVADRLSQTEGAWQPMDTSGLRRMFFCAG